MAVRVQRADFDLGVELAGLRAGRRDIGALVSFTGLVRDSAGGLHSLGLLDPFGHTAVGAEPGASLDRLIRSHEETTR